MVSESVLAGGAMNGKSDERASRWLNLVGIWADRRTDSGKAERLTTMRSDGGLTVKARADAQNGSTAEVESAICAADTGTRRVGTKEERWKGKGMKGEGQKGTESVTSVANDRLSPQDGDGRSRLTQFSSSSVVELDIVRAAR